MGTQSTLVVILILPLPSQQAHHNPSVVDVTGSWSPSAEGQGASPQYLLPGSSPTAPVCDIDDEPTLVDTVAPMFCLPEAA